MYICTHDQSNAAIHNLLYRTRLIESQATHHLSPEMFHCGTAAKRSKHESMDGPFLQKHDTT